MSVDLTKGATVELVKTLSDDLRAKSDGTKWESAGAAIRAHDAEISNVMNDLYDSRLINNTIVQKKYVNYTNGTVMDSNSYGYIIADISPYKTLHIKTHCTSNAGIVFYDESDTYISGIKNLGTDNNYLYNELVTVPDGAAKVGVSCLWSYRSDLSIYTTPLELYTGLADAIDDINATLSVDLEVSPKDTTFFHVSNDIVDPSTCINGEFVNQATGAFVQNDAHTRTDYIPIVGGASYCVRFSKETVPGPNTLRYAFYDSSKAYTSGAIATLEEISYIISAPAHAAFLVASKSTIKGDILIALSDAKIDIEPYSNTYVLPQYIYDEVDGMQINVPDTLYATAGFELNIYFENITEDWERYYWDVQCAKGMQLERGYRVTPTDNDVGTYPLTIFARSKTNPDASKTITTSLIISASTAGSGQTKSIIVLGDSTTDNGTVITKLNENFSEDSMNISTIGTRGTSPNMMEGRSGWTLTDYFTKASITYTDGRGTIYNPFYNPTAETFDASYYFDNTGVAKPDFFIINMGINDMFAPTTDQALEDKIETALDYLDSMVASVAAASPNSKIGVCVTIPPNHSQDAFGKAYACSQTRDRYKRNNTLWAAALISHFATNDGVYIIPIHTNLDTVYNMGLESIQVNARNTETYDSPIANGGVHPVESGYWQIADVYTAFLKATVN